MCNYEVVFSLTVVVCGWGILWFRNSTMKAGCNCHSFLLEENWAACHRPFSEHFRKFPINILYAWYFWLIILFCDSDVLSLKCGIALLSLDNGNIMYITQLSPANGDYGCVQLHVVPPTGDEKLARWVAVTHRSKLRQPWFATMHSSFVGTCLCVACVYAHYICL